MQNRVRFYRIYHGVSLRWLARKVRCSSGTLGAIERGESAPNVYLALRIARALGVTVEDLWGDEET